MIFSVKPRLRDRSNVTWARQFLSCCHRPVRQVVTDKCATACSIEEYRHSDAEPESSVEVAVSVEREKFLSC
eukprot:3730725-Rhodomonas_salina.3